MTIDHIISSIDSEIARLKKARALLSSLTARKVRKPSAAARKRMSEAQRKRWAKEKTTTKG